MGNELPNQVFCHVASVVEKIDWCLFLSCNIFSSSRVFQTVRTVNPYCNLGGKVIWFWIQSSTWSLVEMLLLECSCLHFKFLLRGKNHLIFEFKFFSYEMSHRFVMACWNNFSDKNITKICRSIIQHIYILPHGNHQSIALIQRKTISYFVFRFSCRRSNVVMCFADKQYSWSHWMNCAGDQDLTWTCIATLHWLDGLCLSSWCNLFSRALLLALSLQFNYGAQTLQAVHFLKYH